MCIPSVERLALPILAALTVFPSAPLSAQAPNSAQDNLEAQRAALRTAAQDKSDVVIIAGSFANRAQFMQACRPPEVAKVRTELESYVAANDSSLVVPALQTFDRMLSQSAQRAVAQNCGSPESTLRIIDIKIEEGKKQFLQIVAGRKERQTVPASTAQPPAAGGNQRLPQTTEPPSPQPPAVPANDFTNDPRIASLSEEVRPYVASAAASFKLTCEKNYSAVNAYDCTCYANALLDNLLKQGPRFTTAMGGRRVLDTNNVQRSSELRPCLSEAAITQHFLNYTKKVVGRNRQYASQVDAIGACVVGRVLAELRKVPSFTGELDQYFFVVFPDCQNASGAPSSQSNRNVASPPAPAAQNASANVSPPPPANTPDPPPAAPEPKGMAGCWTYNGIALRMEADGRVTGFLVPGRWREEGGNRYSITWVALADTVRVSPDGRSLSGANNYGPQISATRAFGTPATQSFVGAWQWSNGATVVVSEGGLAKVGPLSGRWSSQGGASYKVEWDLVLADQLTLSFDGKTLSGKNNVGGTVGGSRVTCGN